MLKSCCSQNKGYSKYISKHYGWKPHLPRLLWRTNNVPLDSLGDALLTQEIVMCKARQNIVWFCIFDKRNFLMSNHLRNKEYHLWSCHAACRGSRLALRCRRTSSWRWSSFWKGRPSQGEEEKTTTSYEMARMLGEKTVRSSREQWLILHILSNQKIYWYVSKLRLFVELREFHVISLIKMDFF